MSQDRMLRATAALMLSVAILTILGLSVSQGAADSEAWAVLVQPTDLSVVLEETVAHNVAVREYRREFPVTATTSLAQIDLMTETFEVTFSEPYTGQLALQTLRDEHWYRWADMVSDWHRVASETLAYEQPNPDYDTVEDADRIGRLLDAVVPITGCWDAGTCPAVPQVVQVTVFGSDSDLATFEQSPLVDFLYYFPSDEVSSLPNRFAQHLVAAVRGLFKDVGGVDTTFE